MVGFVWLDARWAAAALWALTCSSERGSTVLPLSSDGIFPHIWYRVLTM
jgi:hypothetical protein